MGGALVGVEDSQRVIAKQCQRPSVAAPEQESILVATADGKGIPMTRADSPPLEARRSKGSKKTAKKEALVTALYSVTPYIRDSQDILKALLPDKEDAPQPAPVRPVPGNKQTFSTPGLGTASPGLAVGRSPGRPAGRSDHTRR
jgi:hypothetical protein